ncbi:glycosyltransferase family 4 protein [Aerococcus urinaeequi]|uniref:glycosyltransferase n=1 Tax=Aerococcus urinaeequi TaxID=51665 RepID=UPI0012552F45|nr:glycosyltransferase [Carnobacterium sp. PL17RED31]
MKLLFSHDSILRKDSVGNYYSTTLNDETFKRYFNIADELTIMMRVKKFTNEMEKNNFSQLTLENLKIIEVPDISNIKGQLFRKKETTTIIKKEMIECDYVVVRLPSFLGMLSYDIARKLKKPCLVELVGSPWDAYWNHSLKGKIIAPYITVQTKSRVRDAKHVVYVTNDFLQKGYPTHGKSVGVSDVMLTNFEQPTIDNRISKILEYNPEKIYTLGTTAAINVKYKGQEYVIKALGKLKKEGIKNFEYQLVGGGNSEYLYDVAKKNDIAENVKFLGALKHSEVFEWLDNIDIYIQPSKQEGLPRAVVEAMSRGLPIIGSDAGGTPELIEKEWIVRAGSDTEIYDLLKNIYKKDLLAQARVNYDKSMEFEESILTDRRNRFYEDFKNSTKD